MENSAVAANAQDTHGKNLDGGEASLKKIPADLELFLPPQQLASDISDEKHGNLEGFDCGEDSLNCDFESSLSTTVVTPAKRRGRPPKTPGAPTAPYNTAARGGKTHPEPIPSAGTGTVFSRNPHISSFLQLNCQNEEFLKRAHRLIFGNIGTQKTRLLDMQAFNGFQEEVISLAEVEARITKHAPSDEAHFKHFCAMLNIPYQNNLLDDIAAAARFLMCPPPPSAESLDSVVPYVVPCTRESFSSPLASAQMGDASTPRLGRGKPSLPVKRKSEVYSVSVDVALNSSAGHSTSGQVVSDVDDSFLDCIPVSKRALQSEQDETIVATTTLSNDYDEITCCE